MINYENADFTPFLQPVIQSRYDIIEKNFLVLWNVVPSIGKITTSKRFRLIPSNKAPKRNESLPWCKQEWPDFECPDIPFEDLSYKIKPWFCEAHFYFHPPSDNLFYYRRLDLEDSILRVPAAFKRQFWIASPEQMYGKDLWNGNWKIVTTDRHDVLIYQHTTKIKSWVSALTQPPLGIQDSAVSGLQLLLAYTKLKRNTRRFKQFSETWHRTLLCRYCHYTELPFYKIFLGNFENRSSFIKRLQHFTSSINNIIHLIWAMGRPPSSSLHTAFDRLPKLTDLNQVHKLINDPERSLDEARWELEARVLSSVFENITFATIIYQVVGLSERFEQRQKSQKHAPFLVIIQNGRLDQL